MQYTDKVGTITRVGPKKTEFPNGNKDYYWSEYMYISNKHLALSN